VWHKCCALGSKPELHYNVSGISPTMAATGQLPQRLALHIPMQSATFGLSPTRITLYIRMHHLSCNYPTIKYMGFAEGISSVCTGRP